MKKKYWTTKSGEVPEITREMLREMRPLREVDPEFVARVTAEQKKRGRGPGRPAGRTKKPVSISLDQDLLDILRASGAGWQTRINALLRAAVGLQSPQ